MKVIKLLVLLAFVFSFIPVKAEAHIYCIPIPKGNPLPTLAGSGLVGAVFTGVILAMVLPNVKGWSDAKAADEKNGNTYATEAFQSRKCFPQQWISSHLPGGDNYKK